MRTMMRVILDCDAGNQAVNNGRLAQVIEGLMNNAKPEAAYFTADGGKRTAYFFFDMKDSSQMPLLAEPAFQTLKAEVSFQPVMTPEELQKGLQAASGSK